MNGGEVRDPEQIAVRVLDTFERAESDMLTLSDVPLRDLRVLLASHQPELPMIGMYAMSCMPADTDLSQLGSDPNTAFEYGRFLIAEHPQRATRLVESPIQTETALISSLHQLMSRLQFSSISPTATSQSGNMTIIIHGTHAATSTWWHPGSSFWSHVNNITGDVYGGSDAFSWSGANRHGDREQAATDLINWVTSHPAQSLDVIAHSHGGNVGFLATRLGLKVHRFITLGTPIRLEYLPDLRNVDVLHNVFSTRDRVQTPPGTFPNRRGEGRTLGDGISVLNHRATDNGTGKQPAHSDLHDPPTWIASGLDSLLS